MPESKCHDARLLLQQGKIAEAEEICDEVLQHDPKHPVALQLLGFIIIAKHKRAMNRLEADLAGCAKEIARNPEDANAHFNHGHSLKELKRFEDAIASYDLAISLEPNFVEALIERAILLPKINRFSEAIASLEALSNRTPHRNLILCYYIYIKLGICDWSSSSEDCQRLFQLMDAREVIADPFVLFFLPAALARQAENAASYAKNYLSVQDIDTKQVIDNKIAKRAKHAKIRLGYFSPDFRGHPLSYLTVNLFEKHDRSRFEIFGFYFGPEDESEIRRRIKRGFDGFFDVSDRSDERIAELAREHEIDIAIDMCGYTKGSRAKIFSYRAAPIQVNFLGFAGTMGANFIDYIIADRIVVEERMRIFYAEKIAYLPHTYYPTSYHDDIFAIDRQFERNEVGLPDGCFVFCCFNKSNKLTPGTFDSWMNILRNVEGSVLWLLENDNATAANLCKEASKRGVDQNRLIFAPPMPLAEHVARYKLADLFLDTLPYNAHTTATDALWAGLPVLTQIGDTFSGRVAASLLTAIGLSELITNSTVEYEALAVELARCPQKLAEIRTKLAANRLITPLFDTDLFTKKLETAYAAMYERYHADLPPDHIFVKP